MEKTVRKSFYKKVFLLELLDFQEDYARTETNAEAKKIEKLLHQSYRKLGTLVIIVPKMSIEERVKFILANL